LRVLKHAFGVEKRREWGRLFGDGLLKEIVGHLLLPRRDEVSLVIGRQMGEKRGRIDDVRIGGYGQSLGDFGGD
jgi:hypothetical protein